MSAEAAAGWTWLRAGREIFPGILAAIDGARESVCLETYIFAAGYPGEAVREALLRAQKRGVRVRVLVDALGSITLPSGFWDALREAGGEIRQFNPLTLRRLGIRNHRKLLVCDGQTAFFGGFNVAPEYDGDGVTRGWWDVGLKAGGPLAAQLAATFDDMFARAEFQHKRFTRWRKSDANKALVTPDAQLLLSGPGRGHSPLKRSLRDDLDQARDVRIMVAYFLPTFNALHHRQRTAIIVLNVLAGWTVVGWLVALIWALNNDNVSRVQRAADRR